MEQRIPKLIHYCWLGDNKPNFILRRCISTFYKLTGGVKSFVGMKAVCLK